MQVGAAKEYVNEYQQFGEGRELSDCGPAPAGNKVTDCLEQGTFNFILRRKLLGAKTGGMRIILSLLQKSKLNPTVAGLH